MIVKSSGRFSNNWAIITHSFKPYVRYSTLLKMQSEYILNPIGLQIQEKIPQSPPPSMLRMYVSFLYFHQLKSTFEVDEMMQIRDQFVFKINTFPANECDRVRRWEEERLKSLHLYVFPPNISLTRSKKGAMCFVYILV